MLLSTKKCPHTGVTNFYSDADPYLAVGSIERRSSNSFTWRCYADGHAFSGRSVDLATARERLSHVLVSFDDTSVPRHLAS
jgi:hypothetical protein